MPIPAILAAILSAAGTAAAGAGATIGVQALANKISQGRANKREKEQYAAYLKSQKNKTRGGLDAHNALNNIGTANNPQVLNNNPNNDSIAARMNQINPIQNDQGIIRRYLEGTPNSVGQFQNYTPYQQEAMNKFLQQALGGIGNTNLDFGPIANKAKSDFAGSVYPNLVEGFSNRGSGNLGSSALARAMTQSKGELANNLAANESAYNLDKHQALRGLAALGLTPQFENQFIPGQPGALHGAAGAALGFGEAGIMDLIKKYMSGNNNGQGNFKYNNSLSNFKNTPFNFSPSNVSGQFGNDNPNVNLKSPYGTPFKPNDPYQAFKLQQGQFGQNGQFNMNPYGINTSQVQSYGNAGGNDGVMANSGLNNFFPNPGQGSNVSPGTLPDMFKSPGMDLPSGNLLDMFKR